MDIVGMFAGIGWIAALCLLFGVLLAIFEMFVPGFGIPGIVGVVLLTLGISLTARTVVEGLFLVLIILAVLGIGLIILLRSATKGRLAKTFVLNDSLNKEAGFSGTDDLSGFLGKEGVAHTVLRPAGVADFGEVKLDVVTEAEYLAKGAKVKVIKVEGRRIVVRELSESSNK
jgi:membrane-bound ClpP family serine protease